MSGTAVLNGHWLSFARLFDDAHGAMRTIMWHITERERGRGIHYVHWASKAYEDESVFMSEAHLGWRRRKFTTSIQPAKAYEDESVIMSGPH